MTTFLCFDPYGRISVDILCESLTVLTILATVAVAKASVFALRSSAVAKAMAGQDDETSWRTREEKRNTERFIYN